MQLDDECGETATGWKPITTRWQERRVKQVLANTIKRRKRAFKCSWNGSQSPQDGGNDGWNNYTDGLAACLTRRQARNGLACWQFPQNLQMTIILGQHIFQFWLCRRHFVRHQFEFSDVLRQTVDNRNWSHHATLSTIPYNLQFPFPQRKAKAMTTQRRDNKSLIQMAAPGWKADPSFAQRQIWFRISHPVQLWWIIQNPIRTSKAFNLSIKCAKSSDWPGLGGVYEGQWLEWDNSGLWLR